MKLIKFSTPHDKTQLGKPAPIKKFLPDWYRKAETTFVDKKSGQEMSGLKKCIPFLDIMMSGYTLVTPFDIYVSKAEDGSIKFGWDGPDGSGGFIGERPDELGATIPRPAGHLPNHLVWAMEWGFKVPRGWSILVSHPFNRFDLPFTTTSGLIDSDKFWGNGNMPFFLKEGFTGTIPANTPIAQLVPVKRASWQAVHDQSLLPDYSFQGNDVRKEGNSYKKSYWVKKEYK